MNRKKSPLFCLNLIRTLHFMIQQQFLFILMILYDEVNELFELHIYFAMKLSQSLAVKKPSSLLSKFLICWSMHSVMRRSCSSSSNSSLVLDSCEHSDPGESSRKKRLLLVTPIGAVRYSTASFKHVSNIISSFFRLMAIFL